MNETLLPCPFCGREAQVRIYNGNGEHGFFACCGNDDCPAYAETDIFLTEAEAIARWNNRAERTCRLKFATERMADTSRWCSECDADLSDVPIEYTNYCPSCGAKVVEL